MEIDRTGLHAPAFSNSTRMGNRTFEGLECRIRGRKETRKFGLLWSRISRDGDCGCAKRAEWSYRTCCEIWEIQGRAKCRSFFRAIFDSCLQPMFSMREDCFKHKLELHQKRTRTRISQDPSAVGGHMKREMDKLRAGWNTILEIGTRDAESEERVKRELESKAIQDIRMRGFFEQAWGFTTAIRSPLMLALSLSR